MGQSRRSLTLRWEPGRIDVYTVKGQSSQTSLSSFHHPCKSRSNTVSLTRSMRMKHLQHDKLRLVPHFFAKLKEFLYDLTEAVRLNNGPKVFQIFVEIRR